MEELRNNLRRGLISKNLPPKTFTLQGHLPDITNYVYDPDTDCWYSKSLTVEKLTTSIQKDILLEDMHLLVSKKKFFLHNSYTLPDEVRLTHKKEDKEEKEEKEEDKEEEDKEEEGKEEKEEGKEVSSAYSRTLLEIREETIKKQIINSTTSTNCNITNPFLLLSLPIDIVYLILGYCFHFIDLRYVNKAYISLMLTCRAIRNIIIDKKLEDDFKWLVWYYHRYNFNYIGNTPFTTNCEEICPKRVLDIMIKYEPGISSIIVVRNEEYIETVVQSFLRVLRNGWKDMLMGSILTFFDSLVSYRKIDPSLNFSDNIKIIELGYFLYMCVRMFINSKKMMNIINILCTKVYTPSKTIAFQKLGHPIRNRIRVLITTNILITKLPKKEITIRREEDSLYARLADTDPEYEVNPITCKSKMEFTMKQQKEDSNAFFARMLGKIDKSSSDEEIKSNKKKDKRDEELKEDE